MAYEADPAGAYQRLPPVSPDARSPRSKSAGMARNSQTRQQLRTLPRNRWRRPAHVCGKSDSAAVTLAMERLAAILPHSETKEFPRLDHFGIERTAPREV